MSTWLEAFNLQSSSNATTTNTAARPPRKYYSRRQRDRNAAVKVGVHPGAGNFGTVGYTALNQQDIEQGNRTSPTNHSGDSSDCSFSPAHIASESESSVEDLFISSNQPKRRQVRRKMMRKGNYSMRDTFETSRQYALATHGYLPYCKQQQKQLAAVAGPSIMRVSATQQQQQFYQPQPKQYCNSSNKWLPYNQSSTAATAPAQVTTAAHHFDNANNWQHQPPQQHASLNQQPSKHISNGADIPVGALDSGNPTRTFITPADIPPPPPHPSSNLGVPNGASIKRFHSARYSSRCQCEHPIELKQPATAGNVSANGSSYHNIHANHAPHPLQCQQPLPPPATPYPAAPQQSHHRATHHCTHNHLPPPSAPRDHLLHTPYQEGLSQRSTDQLLAGSSRSYHQQQQQQQLKKQSLVYSEAKIRRLRIILGVVGGIIIAILLGTALYFIIRGSDAEVVPPQPSDNGIHLDDILTGQLTAKRFNGSWSTGSNIIYKEGNAIVEYDVVKNTKTTILVDDKNQYVLHDKSEDGQFLLLAKNYKKNFRHSYEAEYDLYNISSRETQPLKIGGDQKSLIMVQWAPVGNGLIINFERNLYYKPSAFADEIAITSDENPAILNGVPDWVYEEEVFGSNSAIWFNPNGSMIAFIKFDDSPTHVINFPYYGEAGDLRYQYPYNRLVAYPKAGSSNPRVKLFTADLIRAAAGSEFLTEIIVPSALNTETDYLITVVSWLNNENVLSVWMNRIQNQAYLQVSDGLKRYEIYNKEATNGWIDLFSPPFKNRDGSRIALILPQLQDDDTNYRHLCTLSTGSANASPEPITKGKYVVQSILHWDTESNIIFYTANTEQNSEVLHIYAVRATTGQTPKCLSCKLQTSGDVEQNYYSAEFNGEHQVLISSLGPGIPIHVIYEWSYANNQVTLKELFAWETNESLRTKLQGVAMPTLEIQTISIGSGFTAKVLLQLPPNLDRSGKTKYPMLVDVYGGPDSYSVVNKWNMDWGTYLSSNQSVIYAKIDGRGSGLRGDKLLHAIYLKLGTAEITDQIDVAKELQQKFEFIDSDHTGIWGWSYGGYAAAMALANDDSLVYQCAASIAPVTDWAYYDSIYTERYMRLPTENEAGYASGRLSTRAKNLRGKKFLLVHGTLDDNVHYQQAMILAKNLERNDILFKQISYPDEDHGLGGVRPHLYHSLDRFFGECFANKRMMESKRR